MLTHVTGFPVGLQLHKVPGKLPLPPLPLPTTRLPESAIYTLLLAAYSTMLTEVLVVQRSR